MTLARSRQEDAGNRAVILLILGIVVAIPNLAWPGVDGLYSFRMLALQVAALAVLVVMVGRSAWSAKELGGFLRTGPNLPILLFAGWSIFGWLRSPFPGYALQLLLQVVGGVILYFAVAYRLDSRRQVQTLLYGLAGAVIASAFVAAALLPQQADGRAAGAFRDSQLYASFLVMMLPLMIVSARLGNHSTRRLVCQIAALFAVVALLFTMNRTTWIGATAGLLMMAGLALRYSGGAGNLIGMKHRIVAPLLIAAIAIAGFLLIAGGGQAILARVHSGDWAGSFRWRTDAWTAAYEMFRTQPLVGSGLGAFAWLSDQYGARSFSALVRAGLPPSLAETAHNQYFQLLAELGLVGLLLYLAILGAFFVQCGRVIQGTTSRTTRWLLIGTVAAVCAQVVDAFGNPSYQFADVSLFFWLVLGIGVSLVRQSAAGEASVEAEPILQPVRPGLPARAALAFAQCLVLVLGLSAIGSAYAGDGEGAGGGARSAATVGAGSSNSTLRLGLRSTAIQKGAGDEKGASDEKGGSDKEEPEARGRGKKKPPGWLVPALIGSTLAILIPTLLLGDDDGGGGTPGYTEIVSCRIEPPSPKVEVPPPGSPPVCQQFVFLVTIRNTNGTEQELDLTNSPNTTWTATPSSCVIGANGGPGDGLYCVPFDAPLVCAGQPVTIQADFASGSGATCTAQANLHILGFAVNSIR